ncbi:MAG TPA: hypothetical protein VLC55_10260 [Burkholderiales bacterium]|nr:hypothetical protein [Burkholderiales bacterium]
MTIPDFTDAERWVVESALKERFGAALPPVASAEAELQLDPGSEALTLCPALQWNSRDAGFVLFKLGAKSFRGIFYYEIHEQYDTGAQEYEEIGDCVSALLKLQEENAARRAARPRSLNESFADPYFDT